MRQLLYIYNRCAVLGFGWWWGVVGVPVEVFVLLELGFFLFAGAFVFEGVFQFLYFFFQIAYDLFLYGFGIVEDAVVVCGAYDFEE